jgi:hypothetical protein
LAERAEAGRQTEKKIAAVRSVLSHLSDAEKIRSLALAVYDYDNNPRFKMSWSNPHGVTTILHQDPNLISDVSELRKMLTEERDPRKFYLLSKISNHLEKSQKINFILEHHKMLFEDGPVARPEGEYTDEYFFDISIFAERRIRATLKMKGLAAPERKKGLTHDEGVVLLDEWLTKNWFREGASQRQRGIPENGVVKVGKRSSVGIDNSLKKTNSDMRWPIMLGALAVLLAVGFLVKNKIDHAKLS